MSATPQDERLVAEPEVKLLTGLSRAHRWRLEADGKFPCRVRVGTHAVRWRVQEIRQWAAALPPVPAPVKRRTPPPAAPAARPVDVSAV
ncbi:MAG: helix-turn-helix transcriptional regulator [Acetobacteraceae bacterium]